MCVHVLAMCACVTGLDCGRTSQKRNSVGRLVRRVSVIITAIIPVNSFNMKVFFGGGGKETSVFVSVGFRNHLGPNHWQGNGKII